MPRQVRIIVALIVAALLTILAWDGWLYIQSGYSLGVQLEGFPQRDFHIDFPQWRAGAHILLWVGAMGALVAYAAGHARASRAAWLAFGAALTVGLYDVRQSGTLGSPTSIWTIVLLFLFALLTRLAPAAPGTRI